MNFYKGGLTFDYTDDKEIKLLIPYVMMEAARQTYGLACNTFDISIEGMWNLVTMGQHKLKKREQQKIVELFKQCLEDDTLEDFNSVVTFRGYWHYGKAQFIKIDMRDIATIFIKSTLAKLPKHLAILINVQSYFDGSWIYLSFEDLVEKIIDEVGEFGYHEDICQLPHEWFKHYTAKDLKNIKGKFIAFNTVDNILTTRHSSDKNKFDKKFLARDNFDTYIKELEEWGIICKVQTNCGTFDNKVVFCRCEHKQVVEQYYIRVDEVGAYAERKQQQEEQIPPVKGGGSFVQAKRERKASEAFSH